MYKYVYIQFQFKPVAEAIAQIHCKDNSNVPDPPKMELYICPEHIVNNTANKNGCLYLLSRTLIGKIDRVRLKSMCF